ncbi:sulfite exporter TauE/SafE family protein [Corynebacterium sp. NPDC060344]|uniref:sulfite exporter TauE/SafE family protein n=1 Tax=Corynebacterium sp. NPDC060344 TaxID=3347101 RepID=UPI00365C63A4
MERIVLFALIGLGAQLVDGTLGMAFGVTATTLFILSGTGAATASAVVHVVEVGTTFASGVSHWRFGNVNWGRALRLGIPGAIGAFAGATFLSSLDGDVAKPVTSTILLLLGLWVLIRFAFLPSRRNAAAKSWGLAKLGPLGLVGGLLDATGGGGWGPVTTSTMLSAEADQPRRVIGTVSAAEFLVTCAAVLGFLPLLRQEFAEHTLPILGLLVGGVIAAPIAAILVGRINPRTLGIVIGGVLVLLNLRTLFGTVVPLLLAWVAVVAAILIWSRRHDTLPWLRPRVTLQDPAPEREKDRAV